MDTPAQDMPDRATVDQWRDEQLIKAQDAFGKASDIVRQFRQLAEEHPDDAELRELTEMLAATFKQLLNTVTCKVITNGIAADWVKIFGPEEKP